MTSNDATQKESFFIKYFYTMTTLAFVVLFGGLIAKMGYDNLKKAEALEAHNAAGIEACEKAGGRVTYQNPSKTVPVYDDTGEVACSQD